MHNASIHVHCLHLVKRQLESFTLQSRKWNNIPNFLFTVDATDELVFSGLITSCSTLHVASDDEHAVDTNTVDAVHAGSGKLSVSEVNLQIQHTRKS